MDDQELEGTEAPAPVSDEPIRVLIVDDHALFRRGLVMVLEQEKEHNHIEKTRELTAA